MLVSDLKQILNGYPNSADVRILVFDWYPKTPLEIARVTEANNSVILKNPVLVVFAGAQSFNSYDATGYNFFLPNTGGGGGA